LVSKGDDEALIREFRLVSQLMSVLIVLPATLIGFLSEPILYVWTGSLVVAKGTAPILAFMVVGTVLSSCSYPALSILFSKNQLRFVIIVNLASVVFLLPLLILAVVQFGVMGSVFIWGLYGLILYIAFQVYGLRGLPHVGIFSSVLRDFVAPCVVSLLVAGVAGHFLSDVTGKITFVALLGFALIVVWLAALLVCRDLFKIFVEKSKWIMKITP